MNKNTQVFANRVNLITMILRQHKGRMINFTFTKKDGTLRSMTGRLGVSQDVKGDPQGQRIADIKEARGMINVYEIKPAQDLSTGKFRGNEKQWRTVNLNTLKRVKMAGVEYLVVE